MSWIGAGIGAFMGAQRGGILGGVIGAVIGNWVEAKVRGMTGASPASSESPRQADEREVTTLGAIAAMLSKLAKADGRITADEVRCCEGVFDRLGLHGEKREYCIRVFRTAKSDAHTIYDYATAFATAQPNASVRRIVYDILWDLACADGIVSPEELLILRKITSYLRIEASNFAWECERRGVSACTDAPPTDANPYEVLGCDRHATDEEVKRAYREKAKQLHPDVLRAQGLSDELISKANDQMARINAAWSSIRQERGI